MREIREKKNVVALERGFRKSLDEVGRIKGEAEGGADEKVGRAARCKPCGRLRRISENELFWDPKKTVAEEKRRT